MDMITGRPFKKIFFLLKQKPNQRLIYCMSFCRLDVPYPPTVFQTDFAQCNSINISWGPPAREALGGPVTGYLVQIKERDSKGAWYNCSFPGTLRSKFCLITNLKKNTFYKIRVMAKNSIGYGLPSYKVIKTENTGKNVNHMMLEEEVVREERERERERERKAIYTYRIYKTGFLADYCSTLIYHFCQVKKPDIEVQVLLFSIYRPSRCTHYKQY